MKLLGKFLYSRRMTIMWAVFCAGAFAAVFALRGIDMRAVWYPLLLCAVFSLLFGAWGFLRFRKRHLRLSQIKDGEGNCADILPAAENVIEEDYHQIIEKAETYHAGEHGKWAMARRDTEDYYAAWVHQIKAPIAVMRILLQQRDTKENQELKSELFRIEQYVDMALGYVRLGSESSDLVIQEYKLDEIIRKAIRKYAGQFILRKIRLIYDGTDIAVLTDEKWLFFIIEQLLSNAVKYTPKGSVAIYVESEKKTLTVTDTGIGIAPEDLPRIFEKGYTGYNGRLDKKSTGIGLYLSRTAAERLGHKITVRSEPGKGSSFTLDLDSYPLRVE